MARSLARCAFRSFIGHPRLFLLESGGPLIRNGHLYILAPAPLSIAPPTGPFRASYTAERLGKASSCSCATSGAR